MKKISKVLLVLLLSAGLWLAARPLTSPEPVREIKMTAKKYEFNPSVVRVRQGERVRLLITATDRKHGIRIEEYGIKMELPPDRETTVEFVADKAGEFEFKCSVRCGWRHGSMKGKLVVEPAPEGPRN